MHTWYGTVLHQYTTCYRTVPPCSALHRYIPPCNAVHNSGEIDISIWYSVHPELDSLNLLNREPRYVPVQSRTRWYCSIACGVLMQHSANLVRTCLYLELQNIYKYEMSLASIRDAAPTTTSTLLLQFSASNSRGKFTR